MAGMFGGDDKGEDKNVAMTVEPDGVVVAAESERVVGAEISWHSGRDDG